ncbi:hypothetical protein [Sediminicoccus sp. BL-A-41-H5]|uniref:hypothetical protein n=1 Tax=Sediminicoccus sp. BL-A-41-H5 TaxID=3421106 RepID=UPI003D66AD81
MRPLILAAVASTLALPATAQGFFTWPSNRITVTQRAGNACQPSILSVSGAPGARYLQIQVNAPVDGSFTATLEVNWRQGNEVLSYRGGQNLPRGTGSMSVSGPALPANLAGSTIEVSVVYCAVYPRGAPPPGGIM